MRCILAETKFLDYSNGKQNNFNERLVIIWFQILFKRAFAGLRQFLAAESPMK